MLDFDFEKLCSVSLSNINIYACLVCGKYFQGRGKSSHAYFHSIDEGHRVFMSLESAEVSADELPHCSLHALTFCDSFLYQVYILPDNYLVRDPSLSDIQYLLNPVFSEKKIAQLDAPDARPSYDLNVQPYLPGFVGLNNIGKNDYMNVVIQALAHVKPLRNYFIRGSARPKPGQASLSRSELANADAGDESRPLSVADAAGGLVESTELVRRFAALIRKLWNPRAFKGQVSPHEFLQEVSNASKGRFRLTEQGDPVEFLGWLLNRLHADLGGTRKRGSECRLVVTALGSERKLSRF